MEINHQIKNQIHFDYEKNSQTRWDPKATYPNQNNMNISI